MFPNWICLALVSCLSRQGEPDFWTNRLKAGSFETALQIEGAPQLFLVQSQTGMGGIGRWRLVRTPGPNGEAVVSIMKTAEALQSDAEFAGMMIRCRDTGGLQVAFVLVTPFGPRSKPQITVHDARQSRTFEASVLPTGTILGLPPDGGVLITGSWRNAKKLSVQIAGEGTIIRGEVLLDSLSPALDLLAANCPPPKHQ